MDNVDALAAALDDETARAAILADPPRALHRFRVSLRELETLGQRSDGERSDRERQAVLFALLAHGRRARDDAS